MLQPGRLGEVRGWLKDQGFKVRKFGRLGLLRVTDNKAAGACIATHGVIKDLEYVIQVILTHKSKSFRTSHRAYQ